VDVSVRVALERTEQCGTARFEAQGHEGGPRGPAPRRLARETVGVVDFAARRAIFRDQIVPTGFWGGMMGRTRRPAPAEGPFVHFCEGPGMCFARPRGGWSELHPRWPPDLPRKPPELSFLDLWLPLAVVKLQALGKEEVRGVQSDHFSLTLKFDRTDWPEPPRDAVAAGRSSLLGRVAIKTLPDPRPHGLVLAEIWVDEDGLLRRFSVSGGVVWGNASQAHWLTTEMWDFGGPPPIDDRLSQPVIDPVTLEPLGGPR
jgi:hypothetical protein